MEHPAGQGLVTCSSDFKEEGSGEGGPLEGKSKEPIEYETDVSERNEEEELKAQLRTRLVWQKHNIRRGSLSEGSVESLVRTKMKLMTDPTMS